MLLTRLAHESKVRRPMKTHRHNFLNSYANKEATSALRCMTNDYEYFDRDQDWAGDRGAARPAESDGYGGVRGFLIR